MIKPWLGGAALSVLLIGGVCAQTTETTTSRTTVAPAAPAPSGYSATRTERSTFGGASTEVQKSYRSDGTGTEASRSQTIVHPDGATESMTRKEWSSNPPPMVPPAGTINSTTTTTTRTDR